MKEHGALLLEVTKGQKMKEITCLGKSPIVHQNNHNATKYVFTWGLRN